MDYPENQNNLVDIENVNNDVLSAMVELEEANKRKAVDFREVIKLKKELANRLMIVEQQNRNEMLLIEQVKEAYGMLEREYAKAQQNYLEGYV